MEVATVYLEQVVNGELVEAQLFDGISDIHLTLWQNTWLPAMTAAVDNPFQLESSEEERYITSLNFD